MTESSITAAPGPSTAPPRKRYTWWRLLGFCTFVFVMALAILAGGTYYIAHITPPDTGTQAPWIDIPRSIEKPGSVAFARKPRLNVLCLGVDYNYDRLAQHHTKWVRSDTIFVISIDNEAKTLNVLSIPRDCRVEIPGVGTDKINAAYALKETGDLPKVKETVEKFLGISIDHTVIIKEYAAKRLVDAIGGVTVNVEKNMDYDDNWGNLHIHLKKGIQRLNGEQSVGYVRFRNDEEGDRGRIRRQQQFLDALLKELKKPEISMNPSRLKEISRAIKENIETSLSLGEILDVANLYKKFDRRRMQTARIDGDDADIDGVSYIIPNERDKERVVYRLLIDPTGVAPESIRLEVLNGSGIEGVAGALADVLKARGFNVIAVDRTEKVPETFIEDHRNNRDFTVALQKVLGETRVIARSRATTRADLTIIVGEDWTTRYKAYEHETSTPTARESGLPSGSPAGIPTFDVPAPEYTRGPSIVTTPATPTNTPVPAPTEAQEPPPSAAPPPPPPVPTTEAPSPGATI